MVQYKARLVQFGNGFEINQTMVLEHKNEPDLCK